MASILPIIKQAFRPNNGAVRNFAVKPEENKPCFSVQDRSTLNSAPEVGRALGARQKPLPYGRGFWLASSKIVHQAAGLPITGLFGAIVIGGGVMLALSSFLGETLLGQPLQGLRAAKKDIHPILRLFGASVRKHRISIGEN